MPRRFEELDWHPTPLGDISLRRRLDPRLNTDVYEVKLGDEFLMSSLFTTAEEQLAELGLAQCPDDALDVVVGGLGLGYTTRAALRQPHVRSLITVEALEPVIDWHRRRLVPHSAEIIDDPRSRLIHADFFAVATSDHGFDPQQPGLRFHAILVDIDHSPSHLLNAAHAAFYRPASLRRLTNHLHSGGVFALWSNDPPDPAFTETLNEAFTTVQTHRINFPNPLQHNDATNTIYVATAPSG
ncbi:MAG TPA: spermidine synthase [Micromonosporaceae bacterium]